MKKKTINIEDGDLPMVTLDASATPDGLVAIEVLIPETGGHTRPFGCLSPNFARYLAERLLKAVGEANMIHLTRQIALESQGGE